MERRSDAVSVLLLTPEPGWAFGSVCQGLVDYADPSRVRVTHKSRDHDLPWIEAHACEHDLVMVFDWRLARELAPVLPSNDRVVVALQSHKSWCGMRSRPDVDVMPPAEVVDELGRYARVQMVSERLWRLFDNAGLDNGWHLSNAIDPTRFPAMPLRARAAGEPIAVGCATKAGMVDLKGVESIIIPAAERIGARIVTTIDSAENPGLSSGEMPSFHQQLDVYVCASQSEGMSLAVLEAASSGRPIITTRVGDHHRLVRDGETGFVVDRRPEAVADKLKLLQEDLELHRTLGENMAREIRANWSWQQRHTDWTDFLLGEHRERYIPPAPSPAAVA